MLRGRRQHDWLQTAELLAQVGNTHLERFRRKAAFVARDWLPPDVRRMTPPRRPTGSLTVADMEDFL